MGGNKTSDGPRQDRAWVTADEWFAGGTATPVITATFMVNGGLFADAQTHPWQSTPLLRSPLGALAMWGTQRSPRRLDASLIQARMYSRGYRPTPEELAGLRSAIIRRNGAAFLHNAAGFVGEHRPGGHLTTSEHPDLLAAAIRDIAARHGVGAPAAAHR